MRGVLAVGILILSLGWACAEDKMALTRSFKVKATAFLAADSGVVSAAGENFNWQEQAKGALRRKGFDLAEHKEVRLFFNERTETLIVSGSLAELDLIESVLQKLTVTPPLVSLEVRIAEYGAGQSEELDKLLSPSKRFPVAALGSENEGAYTVLLTQEGMKTVIMALEQKTGVDLASIPPVQTVSARAARVAMTESEGPIFIPPISSPGKGRSGFYFNAE